MVANAETLHSLAVSLGQPSAADVELWPIKSDVATRRLVPALCVHQVAGDTGSIPDARVQVPGLNRESSQNRLARAGLGAQPCVATRDSLTR